MGLRLRPSATAQAGTGMGMGRSGEGTMSMKNDRIAPLAGIHVRSQRSAFRTHSHTHALAYGTGPSPPLDPKDLALHTEAL